MSVRIFLSLLTILVAIGLNSAIAIESNGDSCEVWMAGAEWGELSSVVVGNPIGGHYPHEVPQMLRATLPGGPTLREIIANPGKRFDSELERKAALEIDQFIRKLESLGIQVQQPQLREDFFDAPIVRDGFRTRSGHHAAMPRDNLLALPPDLIILAPMAWRSRYREHEAYQGVLSELRKSGFKIIEAPRPKLDDSTYVRNWRDRIDGVFRPVITNQEPLFDAADFMRFGDHIIGQLSHVTNIEGVRWIRSVLPEKYRLHIVEFNDPHPMHEDATIMPLGLGELLVQPERVPPELRAILQKHLFSEWTLTEAPTPDSGPRDAPLYYTSRWINMNILVGNRWAFVEQKDKAMAETLKRRGIDAIPTPLQNFQAYGGSFHCCTLDTGRSRAKTESGIYQSRDLHIFLNRRLGKYQVEPLEALFERGR